MKGGIMNKYIIMLLLLIVVLLTCTFSYSYQNFDDNFHINTDAGEHYENIAWCRANGALGSAAEYWEDNAGCELNGDEVVIYYYNESVINNDENNVYEHVYHDLITTYLYEEMQRKNNLIFFKCKIDMKNMPQYLVLCTEQDEVVCIGGNNLDKIERYGQSVIF